MSYLSRSYYEGDGATTDFTVGFDYLDKAHVKVYLDGTLTTDWVWLNASTIRLTVAAADGTVVLIRRYTSPEARIVDYVSPSSLNEDDLDNDSLQAFYLAQEANDQANAGIADDPTTGHYTAAGKRVVDVADPVDDQDVTTKSWVLTALESPVAQAILKAAEAAASAVAAAASATAAAASATLAGTRETNAAASATAAAGSATAAAGSATAASGSATTASGHASTATAKASEASTSASNASTSASTAASHASTATTKAAEADASADAAALSAAEAAASAGALMPVEDQIDGALDTPFQNADMLVARQATDGAIIKRSWSNLKALIWTSIGGGINGRPAKTTVVDADVVAIADSEDATNGKKVSLLTVFTYHWAKLFNAAVPVNLGAALTGNLTLDLGAFIKAYGTATGNIVFNAVSNPKNQDGTIRITASGGNRTVGFTTSAFATPDNKALSAITSGTTRLYSYSYDSALGKVILVDLGVVS